jgi:hypothetical protein
MLRIAGPILRFRHEVMLTMLGGVAACGFRGAVHTDVDANQPEPDGSIDVGADDSDADGVPDAIDNCARVANVDQHDDDGDGVGDACDPCPQIKESTQDSDGDGVPDAIDNCARVANVDQHDDDGDGVGDACDPCPQIKESTQDSDGDGVPNDCDPRPVLAGDTLVKFEPFTGTGNLPDGWQARGGKPSDMPTAWHRADDVLDLTVANDDISIALFDSGSMHHAVDVDVDVLSASLGLQYVTALADAKSDAHEFSGCGMRFDIQADGHGREVFTYRKGMFSILRDQVDPPAVGSRFRIQFVIDGLEQRCSISSGAVQHIITKAATSQDRFIGLRASNVQVRFRSVAVYRF